jgi:hypothetical protein
MSERVEGGCPRCGAVNRLSSRRCWTCDTPLLDGAQGARSGASLGKILLWIFVALVGVMVLIPVLFLITCFGVIALGGWKCC